MISTSVCDLCDLEQRTDWYFNSEALVVLECEFCRVPMAVWREHVEEPPDMAKDYAKHILAGVADAIYGVDQWVFDEKRRSIPGHWHVHARPIGE